MAIDFAVSPSTPVAPALAPRGGGVSPRTDTVSHGPGPVALSGPPVINPSPHVDPALNLVVLQFFDSKGNVEQTIPSPKQLQAYRQNEGPQAVPAHAASRHASPP